VSNYNHITYFARALRHALMWSEESKNAPEPARTLLTIASDTIRMLCDGVEKRDEIIEAQNTERKDTIAHRDEQIAELTESIALLRRYICNVEGDMFGRDEREVAESKGWDCYPKQEVTK
jgi:hypothetical protein